MKNILITILTLLTFTLNGQEKEKGKFFKTIYEDFLNIPLVMYVTLMKTLEKISL